MWSADSQPVSPGVPRPFLLALLAVSVSAMLSLVAGCNRPAAAQVESTAPSGPATPAVTIVKPQRKTVRRIIEQPGYNIEAFQETPLFAKIAGYVNKVN